LKKNGESEFLEPGEYVAAIQEFHGGGAGADNNLFRFTIGADYSHKVHPQAGAYLLAQDIVWYQLENTPMVRLNLNSTGAPAAADVVFNVDMNLPIAEGILTPGTDFVDVAGNFNEWGGSAHMEDADGDGIYSLTVPGISTFSMIEYKYRINGNWDTSEFPFGGPNRSLRTSYWNNLDDIYNDGVSTVGTDLSTYVSKITLYPNPATDAVTLDIVNSRNEDLDIVVSNLQGQIVWSRSLNAVSTHSETIDLSGFAKGLYFVKVKDQVNKLVVK